MWLQLSFYFFEKSFNFLFRFGSEFFPVLVLVIKITLTIVRISYAFSDAAQNCSGKS